MNDHVDHKRPLSNSGTLCLSQGIRLKMYAAPVLWLESGAAATTVVFPPKAMYQPLRCHQRKSSEAWQNCAPPALNPSP